ncbi:MAG: glycosyltransferase family 39 protein [Devosia sp.]|uniref:ArnT family glycosyltransferase n=1 Tax=Devosia sp. TaxID=1871048 RepID=UPI0024C6ADAE|nr:glycosyltransferase family 39 protein [Devosia sp.]UYN99486.1 MAG: glycosyltransferase family 39 protein [Devosia sp.]
MSETRRIGPLTPVQATLALIIVTLVLRTIGAWAVGWGTGEAYYLASARQFHLSYYDQPPLFLWMIWGIVTATGSDAILLVRLPFLLMFAGSTWLVFDIMRRLHSPLAGFYAALIVNACVLFSLSIGSWAQPDAPMLLFWLATVRVLIEIFFGAGRERPYFYWGLAGLFLGLTFLSKYHALFLVLGTGLYILVDPAQRHWLLHKAPWLALVIALAIFSPVIIWNAQNQWASFGFQGGRALAESDLRWGGLIRMIIGQLVYMVPWLAIPALYIGVRALFAGLERSAIAGVAPGVAVLFAYIAWPPILFFTIVALWSDTQFHFHWQAPGYIMLFMLMGAWAANRNGRAIKAWLWGSAAVTLVILAPLVSHCATGWARQVFPGDWEDPTYSQLPWTEVGAALVEAGVFTGENQFVAGMNWIDCGYIDTQVGGRVPLACFGSDPRNLHYNFDPATHAGWDAIVVVQTGNIERAAERIGRQFDAVTHLETLDITRNGYPELRNIQVFEATSFQP